MIAPKTNPWLYRAIRRRVSGYLTQHFWTVLEAIKLGRLSDIPARVTEVAKAHPDFDLRWVVWMTYNPLRFHVGTVGDYVQEINP